VEIIGETIAAMKLAAAETWKQLWTDAQHDGRYLLLHWLLVCLATKMTTQLIL